MESLRKWFYRPKKDDTSLLAQFFFADEALNMIASELDSFDGRKDPERCTTLVNQLRQSQDKVLTITNAIMDVLIGDQRANRDFRVKFPEDVLQENLAGQLWFGAECLAAGSSIMNREMESTAMRPLARALTKSLENVRNLLRETCLRSNTPNAPLKLNSNELINEVLIESLKIFDKLFAEFELRYVSAMVPVKTTQEYELQQLIGVLFSETLQRALKMKLLSQEMIDDCDPALMFTIPRLAIVSGLLIFPNGPLCIDKPVEEMSEMFRPFRTLLHKIRELLWTLNKKELYMLEKLLCDNEQISDLKSVSDFDMHSDLDDFINQFYSDYPSCKDYVSNFYSVSDNNGEHDVETVDEAMENKYESVPKIHLPSHTHDEQHSLEASASLLSENIEIPSTSGYLIPNTVEHDSIVASLSDVPEEGSPGVESLPDRDSLEVISVAAATLSSILATDKNIQNIEQTQAVKKTDTIENKKQDVESPNDSGVCTENTSLDRSPSLDVFDDKTCGCVKNSAVLQISCQCHSKPEPSELPPTKKKLTYQGQVDFSPGTSKNTSKPTRKRSKLIARTPQATTADDDEASVGSSDTSSFNSNCADDEEIALALQAAEIASRNEVRAKFRSSEDLLHRLFVCIAGVADQLQTNFASDLRNILKAVFLMNASDSNETPTVTEQSLDSSIEYHPTASEVIENDEFTVDPNILAQEALFDNNVYFHIDENEENNSEYSNRPRSHNENEDITQLAENFNEYANVDDNNLRQRVSNGTARHHHVRQEVEMERPPIWIPDVEAPKCMSCGATFTVVKRRHHCRNCGKIFCARCSSNSVPLPKFGHTKPVRVCNKCFMYQLMPFTM
ncbi:hypothetical protein ILUMI_04222 [Ignelater luminosus]|uniref:Lateral signaling target protein 2 homolog n=1 Tax=Ignelater luminosus TaxID=2038154 RepID=A0A8K0GHJ8_IGNLU|nr:hypothetical protein ILUMI_04222 [Ignelater luminosus]